MCTLTDQYDTNVLIQRLMDKLFLDLRDSGWGPAVDIYGGVFPTDFFNAQATVLDSVNLILIDTGCMEAIETVVSSFRAEISLRQTLVEIADTIEAYVRDKKLIRSIEYNHPSRPDGTTQIATATERFVLAHELGHVLLGHLDLDQRRGYRYGGKSPLAVCTKTQFEELQAGLWAFNLLVAQKTFPSPEHRAIAIAGAAVALGVDLIREGACKKYGVDLSDGHPSARERLYMLDTCCEFMGFYDEAFIARDFYGIVGLMRK